MKVRSFPIVFGALTALVTSFPAETRAQVPAAAAASDDNNPAVERITSLNKKALEAYNDLEFEEARKLLKQALDMCASAGLDTHPVAARTHIHMGVVLIAAKQQDLGLKQFRKAIEIQSDIQVTKALANPEILQAFKEASAGVEPPPGGGDQAGGAGSAGGAPEVVKGMQHRPVTRGTKGRAIPVVVAIGDDVVGYTKVFLEYRPEGAAEYKDVEMTKAGNKYAAEIPASATQGSLISYYIEADSDNEEADSIATSGSEDHPYNVSLAVASSGGGDRSGDCTGEDCDDDDEAGPPIFIGVMGGIGYGLTTGFGEINNGNKVSPGFAPASAVQIAPEVGYFLGPSFRLSLQVRYQVVSGTTPLNLDKALSADYKASHPEYMTQCGSDHLCSTRTNSAIALLARATWFFGSELVRPYFSLALGGGYMRHRVTFNTLGKVCGAMGTETCVDTVLAGPVFAGPGAGVLFALTPAFGILADVTSVLGFPKFTYNLDVNLGVAVRL